MGDPSSASDFYNVMRAQWKDGESIVEGMSGRYDSSWFEFWPDHLTPTPTKFYFSGDPVTQSFWSEFNVDNLGQVMQPADRRLTTSSGPFEIASGDTANIHVAVLWARGDNHLHSVTALREVTAAVHSVSDDLYHPNLIARAPTPPPQHVLGFDQNFPNPFSQSTTLRYSLPQAMQVRLAVYDILGRQVELLVDAQQDAGVYLARIELDHLRFTHRMILMW